jgi:hypothetical protein
VFFLRNGKDAFSMKNITFSPDHKTLRCDLDTVSPRHSLHFSKGSKGKRRYKKSRPDVLDEVHLYTASSATAIVGEAYNLPLDQVQKIEIIEKDKRRTTISHALGGVAIGMGIGFAVLTIFYAIALNN